MTFGEMAIRRRLVTAEQVEEVLRHKERLEAAGIERSVPHLMHERGILTMAQIQEVLDAIEELAGTDDGQPIPGYRIEEKLGQGGTGTVYRAWQVELERPVAIKILAADAAMRPEYLARFQVECRAAARIDHPHIVRALTAGEAGGFHYLVMEYVDGFSAAQLLQAGHRFREEETVRVGLQLADALCLLHERRLLHRDIKPSNVLFTSDLQTAKLCDLGLAKDLESRRNVTRRGVAVGTPYYMAPELVEGKGEADIRSDIYSLGATLFHLATGKPPVEGEEPREILAASLAGSLRDPLRLNPTLSDPLVLFFEVILARDPDDRYQTPQEVKEALEAVAAREVPPLPLAERLALKVRRFEGYLRRLIVAARKG